MAEHDDGPDPGLAARRQPGVHERRTDTLPLALRPHRHGPQRRSANRSGLGRDRKLAKQDVPGDRVVLDRDEGDNHQFLGAQAIDQCGFLLAPEGKPVDLSDRAAIRRLFLTEEGAGGILLACHAWWPLGLDAAASTAKLCPMARPETSAPREPVPRYRSHAGPALFAHGFRPFFLLAGLWAVAALALSFAWMMGWIVLPSSFGPVRWHVHEMLFGYVAAAMAGFLLTAIPNWTGRMPLQGWPLLALALLWLAGRVATTFSSPLGSWAAALADLSFPIVFAAAIAREIVVGRNWRNLAPVLAVLLFAVCNAFSHAAAAGLVETEGRELRLAIAVAVGLIVLIGGRIVPSFTRNWLAKRGAAALPAPFGWRDRAALGTALPALAAWAIVPGSALTGTLAGLAAACNLARLLGWRGLATWPEPLLWVLHVAYLWVPFGLGLVALGAWWHGFPPAAATHALTAGAIGGMTLAVMSRATLGHTGRPLHAGPGLTIAYVLVTLAALARIAAPLAGAMQVVLLTVAALAWTGAFLVFLGVCGPMLLIRRADRAASAKSDQFDAPTSPSPSRR